MTKYHELTAKANKNRTRAGRGIASGRGKTAGRGTKGQGSRSGKKLSAMFMGGQRSLVQAVPKARGFKSIRIPAQVVYLDVLANVKAKTIDNHSLYEEGFISNPYHKVKIITRGELNKPVTVHVAAASKSAIDAITKAGGVFVKTAVPLKPSTKSDKK